MHLMETQIIGLSLLVWEALTILSFAYYKTFPIYFNFLGQPLIHSYIILLSKYTTTNNIIDNYVI